MYNSDGSKFSFTELFSNDNTGKSSGSKFAGLLLIGVSCIGLLCVYIGFFLKMDTTMDLFQNITFVIGISASLLGVSKFISNKTKSGESTINNNESTTDSSTNIDI